MITAEMVQDLVVRNNRADLDRSVWYSGHLMTFLVTAEETGGAFAIIESISRKDSSQYPPMHIHTRETETFYVVEGRMRFWVGDEEIEAGPGTIVSLPPYVPHRFIQESDEARMLNFLVPGGFERHMREMSVPAESMTVPPPSDEPVDVERAIEMGARYGVQFLLPSND